jgi:hypothetical protein
MRRALSVRGSNAIDENLSQPSSLERQARPESGMRIKRVSQIKVRPSVIPKPGMTLGRLNRRREGLCAFLKGIIGPGGNIGREREARLVGVTEVLCTFKEMFLRRLVNSINQR